MDGDLQHNPKYLPKIIKIFLKKKIDFLVCVRDFNKRSGLSILRYFASLLLILFINILFKKRVSDPMSGFFIFKKTIYISNKINKGDKISRNNVRVVRPNFGLHPKFYKKILGKRINRTLTKGTRFKLNYISRKRD